MGLSKTKLLLLYLKGFYNVFLHVCSVSILILWTLQMLARFHGATYDWSQVFVHLVLSLSLLALFPGQTLWTYRLKGSNGVTYTIVGRDGDPHLARD